MIYNIAGTVAGAGASNANSNLPGESWQANISRLRKWHRTVTRLHKVTK